MNNENKKLRVWTIINPPDEPEYFPVKNLIHAKHLINALSESRLLDETITCNVFGLEILENSEWCEWEDGKGYSISDLLSLCPIDTY